jgi:hypothetical protein
MVVRASSESLAQRMTDAGRLFVLGEFDGEQYYYNFSDQAPALRPEMPAAADRASVAADDADVVTITGLPATDPNGFGIVPVVRVDGQSFAVADGVAEISFDCPGQHRIVCTAGNFLPKVFVVEAI